MKIRTEEKTEVKVTRRHIAEVEFDTLLVSEKNYWRLVADSIHKGMDIKCDLEVGEYLPDDIGILQLNGELVATVTLEDE